MADLRRRAAAPRPGRTSAVSSMRVPAGTRSRRGASYFAPVSAGSRDRFTIHTGNVVQNISVWTIDDDVGVPYATELIFG